MRPRPRLRFPVRGGIRGARLLSGNSHAALIVIVLVAVLIGLYAAYRARQRR